MKVSRIFFCLIFLFIFNLYFSFTSHAQGLIVNEVSTGPASQVAQEYIELLVVGSAADPTGPVDVRGWIIDDNNGDFSPVNTEISDGHLRIKATCAAFANLSPGDLIVIYNENNRNPNIPPDDPTDANGDGVYILAGNNNSCLEVCTTAPTSTNPSYACAYLPVSFWSRIEIWDDGDAVQVRMPDGTFYHGFGWGDLTATTATFPTGSASFTFPEKGPGVHFELLCGNYTTQSNFMANTAASETPGQANGPANQAMMVEIIAGNYNYSNLDDPANCGTILAAADISFQAQNKEGDVELRWKVQQPTAGGIFALERASDGLHFEQLKSWEYTGEEQYFAYTDQPQYAGTYYYRLKLLKQDGSLLFSSLKQVEVAFEGLRLTALYPNPGSGRLNIEFVSSGPEAFEVEVRDLAGKQMLLLPKVSPTQAGKLVLDLSALPAGMYLISLHGSRERMRGRWLKQ